MISVIIPTHNRLGLLIQTLDSVSVQDHRPLEVIVVDDGSTDGTSHAVADWMAIRHKLDTISYHYIQAPKGNGPKARNLGIRSARGEFLIFLDSDDIMGARHISSLAKDIAKYGKGVAVYSPWSFFKTIDKNFHVYPAPPTPTTDDKLDDWLRGWFLTPHSILWHKSDIVSTGMWDERLSADQDGDLAMRFLAQGGRLAASSDGNAYYRIHNTPGTNVASSKSKAANRSRLRVIYKISGLVKRMPNSAKYNAALSIRYARLAVNTAIDDPLTSSVAYRLCRQASPDAIPSVISQPWLVSALGLRAKLRLTGFIRSALCLSRQRSHIHTMKPKASYNSLQEMVFSKPRRDQ